MKIYRNIEEVPQLKNPVVTVGTFDGLHIGHKSIIQTMKKIAASLNGETVVVTFFPHPRLVLYPDSKNLKFINSMDIKYCLLEELGIDHLVEINFTREFASLSSEDFVKNILVERLGVKYLITGYDHHFGRNREGNIGMLMRLGEKFGFVVEEISARFVGEVAVSSTKIRDAINTGDISFANQMLGYPYSITGKVIKGKGIGRQLGFPTANIEISDFHKLIAPVGVYACSVLFEKRLFLGMANLGNRPTIGQNSPGLEVHIFNFNQDVYDRNLTINFIKRIRDQYKFDSLEELTGQLKRDKVSVLNILEGQGLL
ncbi:MAG: bifunctional riboflavin kinase/FAD synthetase [Bacteroidales bacterium]|nr:bifunctional riboflavin kinase/FAD synthetase [Bacteroidales bacterium]